MENKIKDYQTYLTIFKCKRIITCYITSNEIMKHFKIFHSYASEWWIQEFLNWGHGRKHCGLGIVFKLMPPLHIPLFFRLENKMHIVHIHCMMTISIMHFMQSKFTKTNQNFLSNKGACTWCARTRSFFGDTCVLIMEI